MPEAEPSVVCLSVCLSESSSADVHKFFKPKFVASVSKLQPVLVTRVYKSLPNDFLVSFRVIGVGNMAERGFRGRYEIRLILLRVKGLTISISLVYQS